MATLPTGCYIDGAVPRSNAEVYDEVIVTLAHVDPARAEKIRASVPEEEEWEFWGETIDDVLDAINSALDNQYMGYHDDDPGSICVWDTE